MFTSLSSYIWGGAAPATDDDQQSAAEAMAVESAATGSRLPRRDPSPGEDWVLVGGVHPAPGNLSGALEPLPPSSLGSSPASSEAAENDEDEGDDDDVIETAAVVAAPSAAAANRLPLPGVRHGPQDLALVAQAKAVRAGQSAKQRAAGKALSAKALKRANHLVHARQGGKQVTRQSSMAIKMAGANKNLKQC
jgi:hypothetical protein